MYSWPIEKIRSAADPGVPQPEGPSVIQGVPTSLQDFLLPLYQAADGASFLDGAFRIHPPAGIPPQGLPGLVAWNDPRGWKRFQPEKAYDTFYFCSNGFGDLFGIPVGLDGSILRDRVGVLWVERYEYQEVGLEWRMFFSRLLAEPQIANFFARIPEYEWASAALGKVSPGECFSSNVPQTLGGGDTIENVAIQSLAVHVSFTLQVIRQARGERIPGEPLGVVELYDESGDLLA